MIQFDSYTDQGACRTRSGTYLAVTHSLQENNLLVSVILSYVFLAKQTCYAQNKDGRLILTAEVLVLAILFFATPAVRITCLPSLFCILNTLLIQVYN